MELFENINKLNKEKKEYLMNYLNKLKKFPYIYLWGISESCDEAINLFTKNNIVIKGIIEQNPDKYDYKYKDISVIKQSFDNIDCNGAIVITCSYYETIKNKLIVNYKDIEKRLFIYDGYFIENKTIKYYLNNNNLSLIKKLKLI